MPVNKEERKNTSHKKVKFIVSHTHTHTRIYIYIYIYVYIYKITLNCSIAEVFFWFSFDH